MRGTRPADADSGHECHQPPFVLGASHMGRTLRPSSSKIGECARLREAMELGSAILAKFCVHKVLNFGTGLMVRGAARASSSMPRWTPIKLAQTKARV